MKRMMMATAAAVSLVLVGHGTLHAAGQPCAAPDSEQLAAARATPEQEAPEQEAGAAPGHEYGTTANVRTKAQLDAQKFESAEPLNEATEVCEDPPAAIINPDAEEGEAKD